MSFLFRPSTGPVTVMEYAAYEMSFLFRPSTCTNALMESSVYDEDAYIGVANVMKIRLSNLCVRV